MNHGHRHAEVVFNYRDRTGQEVEVGGVGEAKAVQGVLGLDASRRRIADLRTAAVTALAPLGDAADPLRDLADYLAVRTR